MSKRSATPGVRRARRFHRTREDHALETAEDYTELVLDLEGDSGSVRPIDLARALGVSHVTVLRTLARLERDGLLERGGDRSVRLTSAGREMAQAARQRHDLVVQFLERLGVPPETAEVDAEGIEHHVSETTLEQMRAFLESPESA